MWLVMKAYTWDALELNAPFPCKIISPADSGQPVRFMPVFDRKEDAIAWAGSKNGVIEIVATEDHSYG